MDTKWSRLSLGGEGNREEGKSLKKVVKEDGGES